MQSKIIFATNNPSKVEEINSRVHGILQIISLAGAGIHEEIPEPFDTLKENASIKSQTIYKKYRQNCFSEDTGLFVEALHGAPGVHSARYAGTPSNNNANIQKLLENLRGEENREAYFQTIISLILNGEEYFFEGVCKGEIITSRKGEKGFGYDSIFIPTGSDKTFAEMDLKEKNTYSHRRIATDRLITFLQNHHAWKE